MTSFENVSLTIYCDGGSRGNPGMASSGFVVYKDGEKIYEGGKFLGINTNNFAEYMAVVLSLEWLLESGYVDGTVNFFLDSELVVKQLTGLYKIKNEILLSLVFKIKDLEKKLGSKFSYTHILRAKNKEADLVVNRILDEQ